MDRKLFDINESLTWGWQVFKANVGYLILVMLIIWVVEGIFNIPNYLTSRWPPFAIFNILQFIVAVFVSIAIVKISLRFLNGGEADFKDLYEGYPYFLDMLLGAILYFLIVLGGLILLIVPGIYWGLKYQFFRFLIIDRDMNAIDAIKRSGQITQGSKGHLLLFWLAAIGINILGAIACGIGLLVTIPWTYLTYSHIYRKLEYAAEQGMIPSIPGPQEPAPGAPGEGPAAPGEQAPPE